MLSKANAPDKDTKYLHIVKETLVQYEIIGQYKEYGTKITVLLNHHYDNDCISLQIKVILTQNW